MEYKLKELTTTVTNQEKVIINQESMINKLGEIVHNLSTITQSILTNQNGRQDEQRNAIIYYQRIIYRKLNKRLILLMLKRTTTVYQVLINQPVLHVQKHQLQFKWKLKQLMILRHLTNNDNLSNTQKS